MPVVLTIGMIGQVHGGIAWCGKMLLRDSRINQECGIARPQFPATADLRAVAEAARNGKFHSLDEFSKAFHSAAIVLQRGISSSGLEDMG